MAFKFTKQFFTRISPHPARHSNYRVYRYKGLIGFSDATDVIANMKSFPLFSELPQELQDKIWEHAFPILNVKNSETESETIMPEYLNHKLEVRAKLPAIFHVSQAARKEAKRIYRQQVPNFPSSTSITPILLTEELYVGSKYDICRFADTIPNLETLRIKRLVVMLDYSILSMDAKALFKTFRLLKTVEGLVFVVDWVPFLEFARIEKLRRPSRLVPAVQRAKESITAEVANRITTDLNNLYEDVKRLYEGVGKLPPWQLPLFRFFAAGDMEKHIQGGILNVSQIE